MSEMPRTHLLGWRHAVAVATWILVVAVVATTANAYYAGLGASVGILALLGLGMVLVTGYAGQFSLAVGAFYVRPEHWTPFAPSTASAPTARPC